jgi:hypothetical protein
MKVTPAAPIVVLAMFTLVPLVVVIVLVVAVADTVPPPVAVKAGFVVVLNDKPPVKSMVDPVFAFRKIP